MLNVGDSELNSDWIKTPRNRKSERDLHRRLAKLYANPEIVSERMQSKGDSRDRTQNPKQ